MMINFDELKITAGTALQADKWNNLVDRLKLEVPANLSDQEVVLSNEEKQRDFHLAAGANANNAALNVAVRSETVNVDRQLLSLHEGGAEIHGPLQVKTDSGYLEIGPKNADWAHFYTDRDKYYFNNEIRVDSGKIGSYNENLQLCTMGTARMTVETSGNVGIGTANPSQSLHVMGNRIRLQRANSSTKFVDMRTDGAANDITSYGGHLYLSCDGAGDMVVVNDQLRITNMPYGDFKNVQWNSSTGVLGYDNSSRRFKENIQDLKDNFEAILLAQPKTYTRPGSPDRQEIGFIAEDFHDLGLYPLVDYDEEGLPESLRYEKMGTYMIPVMRRQQERIGALEGEVSRLKEQLAEIRELFRATT
jgi:hypothetical protein